jgi:uncharacterized protein DUF2171
MSLQLDEIQPGWTVVDASGEELGNVVGVEHDVIRIKKGGLMGGEAFAPRDSVAEIETGRVELSLTKNELG